MGPEHQDPPDEYQRSEHLRVSLLSLVAASVILAGCADAQEGTRVSITDSAGIRLIESHRPEWQGSRGWRLEPHPELVIGEPARSSAEEFTRIEEVLTLPDGRIVVANQNDPPNIRFFDPAGDHLESVGREGEGPGEFLDIEELWFAPPDSLVVFDRRAFEITLFGTDGRYLDEVQMELQFGQDPDLRGLFKGRFADGSYLFLPLAPYPSRNTQGSGRERLAVVRALANATIVDTIGVFPYLDWVGLSSGSVTSPLFGHQAAHLVHDSAYYTGMGDDFTIDHYTLTGRHLRRIRRAFEVQPITDELRERRIAEILEGLSPDNHSQARRLANERSLSGTIPAFGRRWRIDVEDNLWIPEYPLPGDSVTDWSIFDRDGRWLGVIEMPRAFDPREIGADYVLGVWTNELDVETVRRYTLIKQ